jgi:hypothetical protein
MRSRFALLVLFVILAAASGLSAIDYGKTMAKKVKETLGSGNTRHFKFATYPVSNFGVATAYDQSGTELCATWTCLASDSDIPTDASSLLSITTKSGTRYADVGTGGTINLTDDEKRDIGIQILLPQLLKVIGITANIGNNKDIQTSLELGPVTIRKIIPDRVAARISALPAGASERVAFDQRQLRLVYSDIVAQSLKITLTVDTAANADTDAKLSGALAGKAGAVIGGSGTDLSVKVDSSTKGKYVLAVASPVVLATWTKRQPSEGHLGAGGIESWSDESIPGDKVFTDKP